MKTVFITGCNRGLGLTLLKKFASNGYDIIAHSRAYNEQWDKQCREFETEYQVKIHNVFFELSSKDEVIKGLQEVSDLGLEIDVLINNAGVNNVVKPLMYLEYEDIEGTFMVNYFTPVIIMKEVASLMVRQGKGAIINISSMMAEGHQPCGTCYDASKAALNQCTRGVAQELAPFNIRINAIACGIMSTGMSANLNEKAHNKLIKTVALKRPAETEEIANVAFFLASDDASYMTGEVVSVNGGAII